MTIGHAILHRPGVLDGPSTASRLTLAHELAHTRQHDRLGPLYLPLHILSQAASALLTRGQPVDGESRARPQPARADLDCDPRERAARAVGASDQEVAEALAAFGV